MEDNSSNYRIKEFVSLFGDWGYRIEEKILWFWIPIHKNKIYYQNRWWANKKATEFRCDLYLLDGTVESWQRKINTKGE